MEVHRINKGKSCIPKLGEVVLIIGMERNRGKWEKSKFIILTKGKDRIFRGVTLLHKGYTIKRPLQVECPLEIRRCTSDEFEEEKAKGEAMTAILKTKILIEDDENDCL